MTYLNLKLFKFAMITNFDFLIWLPYKIIYCTDSMIRIGAMYVYIYLYSYCVLLKLYV